MSSNQYRSQLSSNHAKQADVRKKIAAQGKKQASAQAAATKARTASAKASSPTTASSRRREADRREKEANDAAKAIGQLNDKLAKLARDQNSLQKRLEKAERDEATAAERKRRKAEDAAANRASAEASALEHRVAQAEAAVTEMREMRPPKPEQLRILILAAAPEGDLRVGREHKRIKDAVNAALHRDLIEFDVRPAATTDDLLDGLAQFRPHVIHFSGHSDHDLIKFEEDRDEPNDGVIVSASSFARAIAATDDPPLLVLLNSCHSATQIDGLVECVVPFAIGMADEIEDADAIAYAARFYASVANGQSIQSAHVTAKVALEFAGLSGTDLPTLAHAPDVDPRTTSLVQAPD